MNKLVSFTVLAALVAASADTSVLKFRNSGEVEEITWDGTSLIVPQLCRASECVALAAVDVKQATRNGALASDIAAVSERAQATAKGLVDANAKLIEQDKANDVKFQAHTTSTITHGSKQRADFASDDAAIANALKLETAARKQAVVSLEQSVAEETKALRKRHATLEEMLLEAVERLNTFENAVKIDVSGLKAVDTEDRGAALKLGEDSRAADAKVEQATAALEAKLNKQHEALLAVDAALRAVDAEADAASTAAHKALRVLDEELAARIKAAEDKHDKAVEVLQASDKTLTTADDVAKQRVVSLGIDVEAEDLKLATKIDQAVSDRDEKVALLKLEDVRLNEAGRADEKSLLKLAEDVAAADNALAAKIAELRDNRNSDVTKLTEADAELAAADNTAKNRLVNEFYVAQAAQTLALEQTIARIRSEHENEFRGIFNKIKELQATDSDVTTEFTSVFDSLDTKISDLRLAHDKNIAELRTEDEALRADQQKLAGRHAKIEDDGSVNLSIASLNSNLVAAIREATTEHENAVKALKAADASRSSVSAEDVASLANTVTVENKKLEDAIKAAENAHAAAVLKLKAEDVVLKQADVDAAVRANSMNITIMAEDAKLQQRLDALKATHENEVAKLDREDAAIVNRIVEMTKRWEGETAELGEALSATVAKDKAAAAKKLQQASAARENIRAELKAAGLAFEQNVAKARQDYNDAFDRIKGDHGELQSRMMNDYSSIKDTDGALESRVGRELEKLQLLDLRLTERDNNFAEQLRKAREDHANHVARLKAREVGYNEATEDARAWAVESNSNLEQRINESIEKAEAANYARQEKLSSDLDAADAQLTSRIQAAEDELAQQLEQTRGTEAALTEEDVLATLRLDAFKLRLASEDAKLAARLEAEEANRASAIALLQIAERGHEETDADTLADLKALRKQHEAEVEAINRHRASMETDLDHLTQELDDHYVRYEAEITAAEVAADAKNTALQDRVEGAIRAVEAASHDRDDTLRATAASNREAVSAARTELHMAFAEASAAIGNNALDQEQTHLDEEQQVRDRFYDQLHINQVLVNDREQQMVDAHGAKHAELFGKIREAADAAFNNAFTFATDSLDARDMMAAEVRSEAADTERMRQDQDIEMDLALRTEQRHVNDEAVELFGKDHEMRFNIQDQTGHNINLVDIHGADLSAQTDIDIVEAAIPRWTQQEQEGMDRNAELHRKIVAAEDGTNNRDSVAWNGVQAVRDDKRSTKLNLDSSIDDAANSQHLQNTNVAVKEMEETSNLRGSIQDDHNTYNAQLNDVAEDLERKRSEERAARIAGDEAVDTDINMDLRATSAAATNNFERKIADHLTAETAHRVESDHQRVIDTENHLAAVEAEKRDRHLNLEGELELVDNTRTQEINSARAKHDADVAALHEQDGSLAAAIVARVAAAEARIDGEQDEQAVRTHELLSDARAKSAAADAAAGALLKKLQDQSNMILGVGNPSTAACAATTIGLCNVRDQLHGGVTGECDTARSSGGWCSYRCNNGEFRGEDGCEPK